MYYFERNTVGNDTMKFTKSSRRKYLINLTYLEMAWGSKSQHLLRPKKNVWCICLPTFLVFFSYHSDQITIVISARISWCWDRCGLRDLDTGTQASNSYTLTPTIKHFLCGSSRVHTAARLWSHTHPEEEAKRNCIKRLEKCQACLL